MFSLYFCQEPHAVAGERDALPGVGQTKHGGWLAGIYRLVCNSMWKRLGLAWRSFQVKVLKISEINKPAELS